MNINLGEGNTPLVKSKEISDLYYKNEGMNPTGSFKDRGSFLIVSKALDNKIRNLHICSSGNAALSLSIYSKPFNIDCVCHIPKNTAKGKKQLIKSFGGSIKEYKGIYEDIYHKLEEKELEGWNVTPGISNISLKAYSSISKEILSEGVKPEKVVVPCGNGTCLAGMWKGFKEEKVEPKMIGIQMKGAAPIKKALESDEKHSIVENPGRSLAEGIIASESFNSKEAVEAIKESGGKIETVGEGEIKKGMKNLIKEGIVCEPTSSVVKPVVDKLKGKAVAIITGSGLKNYEEINNLVNDSHRS